MNRFEKLASFILIGIVLVALLASWMLGFQAGSAAPPQAPACDESLWAHVYNPQRLQVNERCAIVTGVIVDATRGRRKQGCRSEADGDLHCWLKLDAEDTRICSDGIQSCVPVINALNVKNEGGALVFEPLCQHRVTQKDAIAACKNWTQKITLPPVGTHVRMWGAAVTDLQHGHMEIHPVTKIEALDK